MTPIRILVVDDQSDLRLLIRLTLSGPDHAVTEAPGAAAALAACRDLIPDAFLIDVMMPEMDGYTLCRRLRADPRFDRSAIILMTAGDQVTERARAAESGADAYLPKPFRPSELPGLVKRLVAGKLGSEG
jgi:CheY-like chemotaxis protein